jgi:hypothetical protein
MKRVKESAEAEIRVERDGSGILPASLLQQLPAHPGTRVRVRVTSRALGSDLTARGVTEEEIEAIAALQIEGRANVVSFLSSEGALSADKGFRRRAKRIGR